MDSDNDQMLIKRWWKLPLRDRLQWAYISALGIAAFVFAVLAILHPSKDKSHGWFEQWRMSIVIVFLPIAWLVFGYISDRRRKLEKRRGHGLWRAYWRWAIPYSAFSITVWGACGWLITDSPYGSLMAAIPLAWPFWIALSLLRGTTCGFGRAALVRGPSEGESADELEKECRVR